MTTAQIYDTVNWDRIRGHEEALAIAKLIPKIVSIHQEERYWHDDFNLECYIIMDHIDFLMYEVFKNHERRDKRP